MSDAAPTRWQAGARIAVRGQLWTIVELTGFTDCDALHLTGAGPGNRELTRTLLRGVASRLRATDVRFVH